MSNLGANVKNKLILLELNEVPFRVIDAYCKLRPDSTLAKMLSVSSQYETITEDRLVLDPWVSWPTLHRGVNDEEHSILHLGQAVTEADLKFPPIWRLLKGSGLSVGIFGSLHSSGRPDDVNEYSFYLPDYFDDSAFALPSALGAFQKLNLSMTRQSARNVSRKIPIVDALQFIAQAPRLGLRLSTVTDSVRHLVSEMFDRSLRIRRRNYQPLVTMDLFLHQLKRAKPSFATFYTNHVAAAMHRYWGAAFPEDYGDSRLEESWIQKYSAEILFAMDKCDVMLAQIAEFIQSYPEYSLLVASSMGQAAISAEKTSEFLSITDVHRFMTAFDVPESGWELKPAMVPCCCVVVREQYRSAFSAALDTLMIDDVKIKRDNRPVGPLSYDERAGGFFQIFIQFDSYRGGGTAVFSQKTVNQPDLGLGLIPHEDGVNCTAQHVPGGSLWTYTGMSAQPISAGRQTISTLDVAPSILSFFGLEKPSYMRGTPSVSLAG